MSCIIWSDTYTPTQQQKRTNPVFIRFTFTTVYRLEGQDLDLTSHLFHRKEIKTKFKQMNNSNGEKTEMVHFFHCEKKTNYNSTEILQLKSTEVSTIVISKHSH